jgi:hypothetical protein
VTVAYADPDNPNTAFVAHGLAKVTESEPSQLDYRPRSFVGQYGAAIFSSALQRVAAINNIPISARSWCHGSILKRMNYLRDLSVAPERTKIFDRFMLRLYVALLALLVICSLVVGWLSGMVA